MSLGDGSFYSFSQQPEKMSKKNRPRCSFYFETGAFAVLHVYKLIDDI